MKPTTERRLKKISLTIRQRKIKFTSRYFFRAIDFLEKKIPPSIKEINIVLTHDKEITRLNKKFLGKNYPTDVLTFKIGKTVEIIVSVETAKRQAADQHHSIEDEILYLIIHGMLHASGYNDDKPDSYGKMKMRQDKIFFEVSKCDDAERKKSGYC
ncbi:MAG: rRNA maturation RNase YbeY [Candidatus Omnitrophica bacterium]|nr:rRNA maturation RNase YbeY [Candidatus Omnitrophota bacterium]